MKIELYENKIMQQKNAPKRNIKVLYCVGLFAIVKDVNIDNRDTMTIDKLIREYEVWS